MDAACHYCERPAAFAVLVRTRATEDVLVQRQRLCEAHDAIVASLASVAVLERRRWHALPERDLNGTVLAASPDRSTIVQEPVTTPEGPGQTTSSTIVPPARRRGLLRSLVGR